MEVRELKDIRDRLSEVPKDSSVVITKEEAINALSLIYSLRIRIE